MGQTALLLSAQLRRTLVRSVRYSAFAKCTILVSLQYLSRTNGRDEV
jgi:hypothetical protein